MTHPSSSFLAPAALALALLFVAPGCGPNGTAEYTMAGVSRASTATVWGFGPYEGAPEDLNVSVWRTLEDSHTVMQVSFPLVPGTYDCAQPDVGGLVVWESVSDLVGLTANAQTPGSTCQITWSDDPRGRVIGDFSAHALKLPGTASADVSGHFDVQGL